MTYTVTATDSADATANDTVTITITGTNDAPPTVTAVDNSVKEATGNTVDGVATFTVGAGLASLTVEGQDVTGVDSSDDSTYVTISGDEGTLVINGYDASTGTLSYSYTEDGDAEHHNYPADDNVLDNFTVAITDVEGDSASDTLTVTITDDVPTLLEAEHLHVIQSTDLRQETAALVFEAGADGVGNVIFNITEGDIAKDNAGYNLEFNGELLYLHYARIEVSNNKYEVDDSRIVATTDQNPSESDLVIDDLSSLPESVGFLIDLEGGSAIYFLNSNGIIDNNTSISSAEAASVGGGNADWYAFFDMSNTSQDALLTTTSGSTVNTSSGNIGIDSNWIDANQGVRIDFMQGLKINAVNDNLYETTNDENSHIETNLFSQVVSRTDGSADTRIGLSISLINADDINYAFLDGDGNPTTVVDTHTTNAPLFYDDPNDTKLVINDGINPYNASVTVYDENGDIVDNYTNGLTVTYNEYSIDIDGLLVDWTYEVSTKDSGLYFDAIQIDGLDTTPKFNIGTFTFGEDSYGEPVDLTYSITGTDSDGDSIGGQVDVSIYPEGATVIDGGTNDQDVRDGFILGTAADEYVLGDDSDEYIDGGAGIDEIHAGSGDDVIKYDANDSEIDGGWGNDTLIMNEDTGIDFSGIDTNKINNIETIDLRGGVDNTITKLTVEDVFDMTTTNSDGMNLLKIIGDGTDQVKVDITNDWTDTNTSTNIDGIDFNVYDNSDATTDPTVTLLVQQDIVDEIV